ncbi:MAG: hypothetical protein HOW73_42375 [Polyangiaceae bacterium]|nr:hypothetical protein [Polyangiaceae bacterium]
MEPSLYAGFLLAWTIVYVAASAYCGWLARRPKGNSGNALLGVMFGALAIASAATATSMLTPEREEDFLLRAAHAAQMMTPVLLVHFAHAEERRPRMAQVLVLGYAVSGLLSIGALTGAFDVPLIGGTHFSIASGVGKAASVVFAVGVCCAAYSLGRVQSRIGITPFLGACLLAVTAVYDCVTALVSALRPSVSLAGFAAFTLTLFVGQAVRLAERREHLVAKTAELSKKSRSLGKSFRELRARQDELVRKEQLAAIGELSAVIAHEVRNPLAIMSNAVSTLRRANLDDDARATLLTILSEESARLNQLVGDLLHYAKPLTVERQSVNLFDLVKRAVTAVDDKPNVLLHLTQQDAVPRVGGDPLLLRQVLDNLVNNACQAMSSGGTLTVELARVEDETDASAPPQAVGAELVIRDTGEGMDTVVRSRALDPFFTTRPSGTGLGLAIVARVIDAHGGRLTIRSELGAGTEVRVFLPIDGEEPAPRLGQRLLPPVIEPFSHPESSRKKEAS